MPTKGHEELKKLKRYQWLVLDVSMSLAMIIVPNILDSVLEDAQLIIS